LLKPVQSAILYPVLASAFLMIIWKWCNRSGLLTIALLGLITKNNLDLLKIAAWKSCREKLSQEPTKVCHCTLSKPHLRYFVRQACQARWGSVSHSQRNTSWWYAPLSSKFPLPSHHHYHHHHLQGVA
jgi:hypothetical protein